MGIAKIARRTFLIGAVAIGGGIAVGYYYVRKPYPNPLEDDLASGEATFNPYVKISSDNTITIITPRAEMGQGVHSTLAAMVAEELEVSLDQVNVEHGPANWAYANGAMLEDGGPFPFFDEGFLAETTRSIMPSLAKVLGLQVTGGSSSIRDGYQKMRHSGCAARFLLVAAAAKRWGVDAEGLETADATVKDPASGKSLTYGELALDAAKIEPPSNIVLKDKKDWKLLGKSPNRTDIPNKVVGSPIYGIDVDLPEMVYGTVKMCPRFGAKAKSHDAAAALKVPGVQKIVPIEGLGGSGFGIIADNTWAAFKGAEALEVEWEEASYPPDSDGMFEKFAEALTKPPETSMRDDGNVDTAFADAPREEIVEAQYQVPWLAHATMEPMNATARWNNGV